MGHLSFRSNNLFFTASHTAFYPAFFAKHVVEIDWSLAVETCLRILHLPIQLGLIDKVKGIHHRYTFMADNAFYKVGSCTIKKNQLFIAHATPLSTLGNLWTEAYGMNTALHAMVPRASP